MDVIVVEHTSHGMAFEKREEFEDAVIGALLK